MELFSQETYDSQIWGSEALIITGYKNLESYIFHWLAVKLLAKRR